MCPHMGGILARNSLKKGLIFGRISFKMDGLSRNWPKIVQNGWFYAKIHREGGYDGKFP